MIKKHCKIQERDRPCLQKKIEKLKPFLPDYTRSISKQYQTGWSLLKISPGWIEKLVTGYE